jgi:ornithine decarboxylase
MVIATAAIEHFAPATINYDVSYHDVLNVKAHRFGETPVKHHVAPVGNDDTGYVHPQQQQAQQPTPRQLIGDALRNRVESIDTELCEPGEEDTFFVADLGEVYRQHMRWKRNLPRVKPFYAVKCNPDPRILQLLAALGTGFDCASKWEIEQVLNMGLAPERIIYAQPCKTNSYVRYVKAHGVRQMTFDNADELYKIAKLYPEAELFLRIMTDDESSLCRLSMKFGAAKETTDGLLATAKDLGLNVVGVSFHVGSGASDPMAFYKAVYDAYEVFEQARRYGFDMKTLDVGGGFCGDTFEDMAAMLRDALDEYFPSSSNVSIIAEPGRYYVSAAFTIACNIIARRTVDAQPDAAPADAGKSYMIYVNDGLYGNFSSIMFDHQHPVAKVLRTGARTLYDHPAANACPEGQGGTRYSVWGPTCDGIDRITETISFGHELDVGDWLYFEDMGAYTKCSATKFNGFSDEHDVIYVCSEPGAQALLDL